MFRHKLLDLIQVAFLGLVLSASGNVDTVIGRTSDTISWVGTTDRIIVFTSGGTATLQWTLATNATPTAPFVQGAGLVDANVTWTGPAGTTNALAPADAFFSPNGTYTLTVSDWGKVTALSFYQATSKAFLTSFNDPTNVFALMTNAVSLKQAFQGSTNNYAQVQTWILPPNVTNLYQAWYDNRMITNGFPVVSNYTSIASLYGTWYNCYSSTNIFPEVNALTNNISLYGTWQNCRGIKNEFPAVSNLFKVADLNHTWDGATSMTGTFPYVNSLTNITSIDYAWNSCSGITSGDRLPSISNLTKITRMYYAFAACSSVTDYFPEVNTLTNVGLMTYTWQNCSALKDNLPAVSNLTKVSSLLSTWASCSSYTGEFPYVNSLTNVGNLDYAWAGAVAREGPFPAVSNLTSVSTMNQTWRGERSCKYGLPYVNSLTNVVTATYAWGDCYSYTDRFPEVSCLTKLTDLSSAWKNSYSNNIEFPAVSNLTNVTSLNSTWYACYNYTGSMPDVSLLSKVTSADNTWAGCGKAVGFPITNLNIMTNCTTFNNAFLYCSNMIGSIGHWIWNTNITDWDSNYSQIGYTNVPGCFTNFVKKGGFTLNMSNSKMQQDNIDQILADLVTSGAGTNTLNLGGTDSVMSNQTPSTAGYVNVTNLRSRGWTVTVN